MTPGGSPVATSAASSPASSRSSTPPPRAARSAEQRIQDAVAVEPDPVELFSVVAEEIALDLGVATVAVVRFEIAGFGTIVGAVEPRGSASLVPGNTVTLDGDSAAAAVFATGAPHPAPRRCASAPASGVRS